VASCQFGRLRVYLDRTAIQSGEGMQEMSTGRSWPTLALRGSLAILFGVMALVWPELTLRVLVYLFGIYALVDGLVYVFHAVISQPQHRGWWLPLLGGLAGVAVGIAVFVWPLLTAVLLLVFIAVRAIILGALDILFAIKWREEAMGLGLLVLGGAVSVGFGLFVLLRPGAGALALFWLVALYAIVVGVVQIILAFFVRRRFQDARPLGSGQSALSGEP
jgi:uncharacterized membrane protein HdeD (DUF308 family)